MTIKELLEAKDELTITYIVKNVSSRDKLKSFLKETGTDPLHRIYIDNKIESKLKGDEIGYRIEAPTLIKKNKNGRVIC